MGATLGHPGLLRFRATVDPTLRLFCFPYAGGGASAYRLWPSELPAHVELIAIQLPGRENRVREQPFDSIPNIVASFAPAIRFLDDLPCVFFGHSLGAVLAFEIARAIAAVGGRVPEHLFLSGRRPPRLPDTAPPMHRFDDLDLVAEVRRRYGGISDEVLQHPDLMALLLPGLRAAIKALETHAWHPGPSLRCAITAYGGTEDPTAPAAHLEAWREETTGAFRCRLFSGDHFYMIDQRAALLGDMASALRTSDGVRLVGA